MAAPEIAVAYVSIVPSLQGFQRQLRGQMAAPLAAEGRRAGTAAGQAMGGGISRGMAQASSAARRSFTDFAAGFRSVDAAASAFTGRMGSLGGATRRAVQPGITQMQNFAAGFRDTSAAASTFTGRVGTLGGVARRALNPAIDAAGRFASGFRSSDAAASAFSGRMGSLGGIARRALQPAISGVSNFRSGFRSAEAAAAATTGRMGTLGGVARRALGGVANAARSVGGRIRSSFSTAFTSAQSGSSALGGALTRMGAIGAAAIGGIGLAAMGRSALTTAADIQQTTASMAGLYGSTQTANDMMVRMREYARNTPLETQSIYDAGKNLAYLGLKGDDAMQVIQNVGTTLMASGNTSREAMGSVTSALLAMQSAGQLYASDIQRVSDQMVPAWDMLASHMGMSIKQVREEVSSGNLTVDDFVAALKAGDGDYFAMMRQSATKTNQTFSAQLAMVKDNIAVTLGETLLPLVNRAAPALGNLGASVNSGLKSIPSVMSAIGDAFRTSGALDGIKSLMNGFRQLASALGPAVKGFLVSLGGAFMALLAAMRPVGSLLSVIAGWMQRNSTIVGVLGAALGGVVVAMVAIKTATTAWAVAQGILNAVLTANPIGVVVMAIAALAAGLIYAYKKSETFRAIVQAAWNGIKTVVSAVWNFYLKPYLTLLGTILKTVGSVAMWLWRNAIAPAFRGIGTVAKVLFTAVVTAVLLPIVATFKTVAAVGKWLWRNALQPAFKGIGAVAKWLYQNAIRPYMAAIQAIFRAVGAVAKWLFNSAIKPVWNWIGSKTRWLYQNAIKPQLTAIQAVFRAVGNVAKWLYNSAVKPVWNWIGSKTRWLYNNAIKPPFNAIKTAVHAVATSFNTAKNAIGKAWNQVGAIAKKPVSFIVNTVYNRGIRSVWNKVAGAFGAPKLGAMKFASGGVLPGYTPGRDVHMAALSGGEAVMRPEWTRAMGPDYVAQMNALAKRGGVKAIRQASGGGFPAFADGGIFGWVKKAGTALKGAGSSAWEGIKKGAGWLKDTIAASARAGLNNIVKPLLKRIPGLNTGFGKMLAKIPGKMLNSILSFSKKADSKVGSAGGSLKNIGGSGVARWKPYVVKALAANKLSTAPGMVAKVLRQIATESGGNPSAVQGDIGDINNKTGDLAKGLMQTISATFNAYKFPGHGNIFNGFDNLLAALHYAKSRYGPSLSFLGQGHGYDSGGWLQPGGTMAMNATGRPEPVLNPQQWRAMSTLAQRGSENTGGLQPGDTLILSVDGRTEFAAYVDRRSDQRINRTLSTPAKLGRSFT